MEGDNLRKRCFLVLSLLGAHCSRHIYTRPRTGQFVKILKIHSVAPYYLPQYSTPMLKTLTIISLLIIAAVALAFTLTPTSPAAREFFPLAKNNRWKHLVVFSGGDYIYYMTETVIDD